MYSVDGITTQRNIPSDLEAVICMYFLVGYNLRTIFAERTAEVFYSDHSFGGTVGIAIVKLMSVHCRIKQMTTYILLYFSHSWCS